MPHTSEGHLGTLDVHLFSVPTREFPSHLPVHLFFIFAMAQPMPLLTGQVLALVVASRVSTPTLGLEESHSTEKRRGPAAPHLVFLCRQPKQCCRRSGSPQVRNLGQGKKCSSGPGRLLGSVILHTGAFW